MRPYVCTAPSCLICTHSWWRGDFSRVCLAQSWAKAAREHKRTARRPSAVFFMTVEFTTMTWDNSKPLQDDIGKVAPLEWKCRPHSIKKQAARHTMQRAAGNCLRLA